MNMKRMLKVVSMVIVLTLSFSVLSFAHSGGTDASGGHRDNNNVSGLGSYHYHCGGHPAHLHNGGSCPYGNYTSSYYEAGWKLNYAGWWYQNGDGSYPVNQWQAIGGQWYYFNQYGYMSENQWIGNYYVGADGAMARNQWIGSYYVGSDGQWIPGYGEAFGEWKQDTNGWWYRYSNGTYPVNQWVEINHIWYYFNGYGYMEADKWIGDYYVSANGAMAVNCWVGIYYVGADGRWLPNY
jgi:hypothetical protein